VEGAMGKFQIEDFKFEHEVKETITDRGKVVEVKKSVGFATEDIIAFCAGIVAILFAIAMVFGKVPVNKLTISVLCFSGAGAAIAQIVKAKRKKDTEKKLKQELREHNT
jgi:hypothetical protein